MPNTETVRPTYKNVGIGKGSIKDESFEFVIPRILFNFVGEKVLNHLGERRQDFALTIQMFELECTGLTELNAFLILEEISALMSEITDAYVYSVLADIYRALKYQVYNEGMAVACLIH